MVIHARNFVTDDRALGGSVIERSLRFNDGDNAHLSRTPSSASNRKTWTISAWVKRSGLTGSEQALFHAYDGSSSRRFRIYFGTGNKIEYNQGGSASSGIGESAQVFRDVNAWYHFVFVADYTNGTAGNRFKVYVNGSEISMSFSDDVENEDAQWNAAIEHEIGVIQNTNSPFDGYMSEINVVDGYAYDASYFGYTESQTGLWRPKRYEGTYGTNGFYLDFLDNSSTSTLGIDKSPNGNDFTASNFSVSAGVGDDSFEDTPTNNFPVMNPLQRGEDNPTVANGNLYFGGPTDHAIVATFSIPSSGKWYWEYTKTADANLMSGVIGDPESAQLGTYVGGQSGGYSVYAGNGRTYAAASDATYMATPPTSTTIMIAFDADTRRLYFGADGNWGDGSGNTNQTFANAAVAHTVTAGKTYSPAGSFNGGSAFANYGQRAFSYAPPTGYKALSSKNLPPNVPSIIRPQKHFDIITYTGSDTSAARTVTGLEFAPDLVWQKRRNGTNWHTLFDTVRGVGKELFSNDAAAETTNNQYGYISAFGTNGFTWSPGSTNNSDGNETNGTFISWCWKAGGAAVSNTDGSITTSVSANTEAGFSIVKFALTSNAVYTVGHGLGKAPQWIMMKALSGGDNSGTTNWDCYHVAIGNTKRFKLNSRDAGQDYTGPWNDTTPTSSVFTSTGSWLGGNGTNVIAYCWTEIPGFSKFGSYTGNGSSDGPYVHLGFRPAWLLIKADLSESWYLYDNKRDVDNDVNNEFRPDHEYAAGTFSIGDFLSNGFKIRATDSAANGDGSTYIYIAFAEQPGTTAFDTMKNAR